MFDRIQQDLRFTWRHLRQSPRFAVATVLTLAVGIGANTMLFSVADAVLFNPLGFVGERRLVIAGEDLIEPRSEVSYRNFLDWRSRARSFGQLEAMLSSNWSFKIVGPDPTPIEYRAVTADFFGLLGIRPALGRSFSTQDDRKGARRVVVISHGFWQRQFGGDPAIVGRGLQLEELGGFNGAPPKSSHFTVIGVMRAQFMYPIGADMWTPLVPALADIVGPGIPDFVDSRGGNIILALGRLRPGVGIDDARRDLDRIVRELSAENKREERIGAKVTPLLDDLVGSTKTSLWALLGASGLLLLVASANVAGLMLVRTAARRREFAIRLALGATRGALSRQLFCESGVLVAISTVAAVLLAKATLPLALSLISGDVPRINDAAIDVRVVAFTAIAGAVTALLCWAAPALSAGAFGIGLLLRSAGRSFTSGGFRRHARRVLVAGELAVAVVLLTCAGLLLRSVARIGDVDLGFNPSNLVGAYVERPARYTGSDGNVRQFADDVIATLLRQPGIVSAAGVGPRGLAGGYEIEGQSSDDARKNPFATITIATPAYFSTMETPLRAGRTFDDRDLPATTLVAIVNETFARRAWPGTSPIGKRFKTPMPLNERKHEWWTVVGLTPDVRYKDFAVVPPTMYFPNRQSVFAVSEFMVRTAIPADEVRRPLRDLNSTGFVAAGRVDDEMAEVWRPWRANLALFGSFAVLTVLLAVIGLYAMVSATVVEQSREIGVRLALGATGGRIVGEVLSRGIGIVALGLAVGVVAALGTTRLIRSLLFQVSALDGLTIAIAPLILLSAATLACFIPAMRAARVDPMISLRME